MHIVLHRINGFPRMGRVGGGDSHQLKPLTLTLAPDHAPPPPVFQNFIRLPDS